MVASRITASFRLIRRRSGSRVDAEPTGPGAPGADVSPRDGASLSPSGPQGGGGRVRDGARAVETDMAACGADVVPISNAGAARQPGVAASARGPRGQHGGGGSRGRRRAAG